jgi:hypothetical protein
LPGTLQVELVDHVAVLTLARPAKRNALSDQTILGIERFFTTLEPSMRAVVLDAEGADSLVVHLEDPDGGNGELLLFVALARRGRVPGSTTRCAAGSPPPCAPRSPRVTSRTGWSTCPSYLAA